MISTFYHFEVVKFYFYFSPFTFLPFKGHCPDYHGGILAFISIIQCVLWNLWRGSSIVYSHISVSLLFFLLFWWSRIPSFVISFLVKKQQHPKTSFSHSLKVGLLTTIFFSFPSSRDVSFFLFSLIPEGYFCCIHNLKMAGYLFIFLQHLENVPLPCTSMVLDGKFAVF